MTKGALHYRFVPVDPAIPDSDLWGEMAQDLGSKALVVWLWLNLKWREPEAEIIERNGQRGLHRRVRFSWILGELPKDIPARKVAETLLWLHDRNHLQIDDGDQTGIKRVVNEGQTHIRRASNACKTQVGVFWPKLLEYREAVFKYAPKGKESKVKEILRTGSDEPNLNPTQPSFKYVEDPDNPGCWLRVPALKPESPLKES